VTGVGTLHGGDGVAQATPGDLVIHTIDLHGLVRVRIETRLPAKLENLTHHLAEFLSPDALDGTPDVVMLDYGQAPEPSSPMATAGEYLYWEGLLNLPSQRIAFDLSTTPLRVWCDRLVVPVSLLLHLALLRTGYSFVHAAAVCFGGRNYLFSGFGGVGKTVLVASVISAGGRLFGDDMVIVGDGQVLGYPQDLTVYPYHVPILRLRDRGVIRGFKRTMYLNWLTDILAPCRSRLARLVLRVLDSLKVPYANVPPKRVFGEMSLIERGVLDEVYFLARTAAESRELLVAPADPVAVADTCTNVLFSEWKGFLGHLYAYSALSPFSVHRTYTETKEILQRLFGSVPCYVMAIPVSWNYERFREELLGFLGARGGGTPGGEGTSQ